MPERAASGAPVPPLTVAARRRIEDAIEALMARLDADHARTEDLKVESENGDARLSSGFGDLTSSSARAFRHHDQLEAQNAEEAIDADAAEALLAAFDMRHEAIGETGQSVHVGERQAEFISPGPERIDERFV